MAKRELTDLWLRKSDAPEAQRLEVWDTAERGLYIRLYPAKTTDGLPHRVWGLRYRSQGRQRRYKLGEYPALSLQEARKKARALKVKIESGQDPQGEKVTARHAVAPVTVRESVVFFLQYYKRQGLRPRTVEQMIWGMEKQFLPLFGSRDLVSLTKGEMTKTLDQIASRPRNSANLLFRLWRVFFNWSVSREYLASSPLSNVKNPLPMQSRDRWLGKSDEGELAELVEAIHSEPFPFGPFFHLLLLTGQRRSEVASMEWANISEERREWLIPSHIAKNGREHFVPLSPEAWDIIQALPKQSSRYVFSTNNETPVSGFSKAKERVSKKLDQIRAEKGKAALEPWTLHDLRRTAASNMARIGIAPHVIEAVLNHISGQISGIAAVYNRHNYKNEMRHALESWARYLAGLGEDKRSQNILQFKPRGK